MAWFKKSDEGDPVMQNTPPGRAMPQEPMSARPEPREPRVEPRDPRLEARDPRSPAHDARVEPRMEPRAPARPAEPRHEARAPDAARSEAPRASVLGPTLRFKGELSAQEDLIIQGSVEGSITHTQSLTVGTDGSMKGDIRARVIIIDGKVEGDLYATESVSIRATAKVKGNVFAPRIGITEGAFFQGQVEMQPSGAAVQEHSARLRQAALSSTPGASTSIEGHAVDQLLSASGS
jgi:cytoskeletal protein CcmA (bactofilin family)